MAQFPNPYYVNQVPGNRALVFLTNTHDTEAYYTFTIGVLPALNHFGIPYRLVDISGGASLPDLGSESAGVVLAHDGVGRDLTSSQMRVVGDAVNNGLGIVSFDGLLWESVEEVQGLFGLSNLRDARIDNLVTEHEGHYITAMQEVGKVHKLKLPVKGSLPGSVASGFYAITSGEVDRALVVASGRGISGGRRVALLFSPQIWLRQYFGHCMGLDGLFWRSLIWIARKPFPTLMMPPFATCRIDDAGGSFDKFGYVGTLNEYNWIPSIGVFTDDIDDEDAREMKRYYDNKKAEFSAHSFHEIGDPQPDLIYLRHDGKEYSFSEMKAQFDRVDSFFGRVGVTPCHTVNSHYDEVGIHALPFLAARNQFFTMDFIPYGVAWDANNYAWAPYPYGHQGFNYAPMEPDPRFWNVLGHFLSSYKVPEAGMSPGEFMHNVSVFGGENTHTDVPHGIDAGVRAVKTGIASGFFGTLMCHEQRIEAVTASEWRELISGIHDGLSGWQIFYRGYDEISQYSKDKARTRMASADYDESNGTLIAEFDGTCDSYLSCLIFRDEDDQCPFDTVDTPSFQGRHTVKK